MQESLPSFSMLMFLCFSCAVGVDRAERKTTLLRNFALINCICFAEELKVPNLGEILKSKLLLEDTTTRCVAIMCIVLQHTPGEYIHSSFYFNLYCFL